MKIKILIGLFTVIFLATVLPLAFVAYDANDMQKLYRVELEKKEGELKKLSTQNAEIERNKQAEWEGKISKLQAELKNANDRVTELTTEIEQLKKRETSVEKPPQPIEIQDQLRAPRVLTDKPPKAAMTVNDWIPYLRGKSQNEVIALLGKPDITFKNDSQWLWHNRGITPSSGINGSLIINWASNSTIYSVQMDFSGKQTFLNR